MIGMGSRLARLCISICGGDVALVARAIELLADKKQRFRAFDSLKDMEGVRFINDLVQKEPNTKELLKQMAITGYVLAGPHEGDVVDHIVNANIAGVVESEHVIDGSKRF